MGPRDRQNLTESDAAETLNQQTDKLPSHDQITKTSTEVDNPGPRTRKPPARYGNEMAPSGGQTRPAQGSIDDPEDLTSDKDDNDAADSDYHEQFNLAKSASAASHSKPGLVVSVPKAQNEINRKKLYFEKMQELEGVKKELKDNKKKRADDRKEKSKEKAERVRLQKVLKQHEGNVAKLNTKIRINQNRYESNLEKQQTDFEAAYSALTKRLKKDESSSIPDDVVRDKLKGFKSGWKVWAREWCVDALRVCPEISVRELIDQGTLDKSASEYDIICQVLLAKSSAASICLNALLAFNVCHSTFAESFLGLLALDGGQVLKEACEKVSTWFAKGTVRARCLWRAQTLMAVDSQRQELSQHDRMADAVAGEARLEQHYAKLAAKFIDHVAFDLLKDVGPLAAAKRREELEGIYSESGALSIQLHKQKAHLSLEVSYSLRENFSIGSDSMQPHASMLLDDDDRSRDGKLPDVVIEPALFAFGDIQGQNYELRKTWMKATVLLIDKPVEQARTPGEKDAMRAVKHHIKKEEDQDQIMPQKRQKIPAPNRISSGVDESHTRAKQTASKLKSSTIPPQVKASDETEKSKICRSSEFDVTNAMHRANPANSSIQKNGPTSSTTAKKSNEVEKPNVPQHITMTTSSNSVRAPDIRPIHRETMAGQPTSSQTSFFNEALSTATQPQDTHAMLEEQERQLNESSMIQKIAEKTDRRKRTSTQKGGSNTLGLTSQQPGVSWSGGTALPEVYCKDEDGKKMSDLKGSS